MSPNPLPRAFFARPTVRVARELVGATVHHVSPKDGVLRAARIVETEAYVGVRDLACHASKGMTERTRVMFGEAGHAYVYLIYGMYWCFNIVTASEGEGCAVLVRAAVGVANTPDSLSGPGVFCREMHIDGRRYGVDLTDGRALWVEPRVGRKPRIVSAPRVNVDYAGVWAKKPWRFAEEGERAVSRPRPFPFGRGKS